MPNWRMAEDYAYCKGIALQSWAWEFLRRNPGYLQEWLTLQEVEAAIVAAADAADNERVAAADSRDGARRAMGEKWGLARPVDPTFSCLDATAYWLNAVGVKIMSEYRVPYGQGWPGYPSQVGLLFSFSQPIEPQIRHAERLIRSFAQGMLSSFPIS
jgi:hypothetical protein